jgi:hypothetical protein
MSAAPPETALVPAKGKPEKPRLPSLRSEQCRRRSRRQR